MDKWQVTAYVAIAIIIITFIHLSYENNKLKYKRNSSVDEIKYLKRVIEGWKNIDKDKDSK